MEVILIYRSEPKTGNNNEKESKKSKTDIAEQKRSN